MAATPAPTQEPPCSPGTLTLMESFWGRPSWGLPRLRCRVRLLRRRVPDRASPRETLIKLSLSTANAATVSADEAEDTSDDEWIRALRQEDAAGIVFGRDGAGGALEQAMRADRALLPEGRQRAPASGGGADAAHLLFAAMVQPVGPGGGRGAVRLGGDAQLRGHRFG